jgi:hypothetical protein
MLKYVSSGDRAGIVISQSRELISGSLTIGQSIELIEELIEAKRYFNDFYGDTSLEYMTTQCLLNIVRMINRSIKIQKENENQTLSQWINKYPIRIKYLKQLESLMANKV